MAKNFWLLMTIAVLVWYCTITIYVAIRGSLDVKHMLRRLAEKEGASPPDQRAS